MSFPTVEELTEFLHNRNRFDYDECQHGTYAGPLGGDPYAMCERQARAVHAFMVESDRSTYDDLLVDRNGWKINFDKASLRNQNTVDYLRTLPETTENVNLSRLVRGYARFDLKTRKVVIDK